MSSTAEGEEWAQPPGRCQRPAACRNGPDVIRQTLQAGQYQEALENLFEQHVPQHLVSELFSANVIGAVLNSVLELADFGVVCLGGVGQPVGLLTPDS